MTSSLERIREELKSLDASQIDDFIRKNQEQIEELKVIEDARSELHNQVLDPVGKKLVDLIEENKKQYVSNRWIAIIGVSATLFSLAIYVFDPFGRDAIVADTRRDIEAIGTSLGEVRTQLGDLGGQFRRVDEKVRVAIVDRLDPINGAGFSQVEGEIRIADRERVVILTHDGGHLKLQPLRLIRDRVSNSLSWMQADIRLFLNDSLLGDEKVREAVSIERLNENIPLTIPWTVSEGDVIVVYGIYRFQVLRILSTQLHGRPQADAEDAIYLLPLSDQR